MGEIMGDCQGEKIREGILKEPIEIDGKDKTLFEIKPKMFAEQLFALDLWLMKKLTIFDFLSKSKEFSVYVKQVSCVEFITEAAVKYSEKKKKAFEFFMNVAIESLELGEYNVAFMVYSAVTSQIILFCDDWEDVSKSCSEKYKDLEQIFGISNVKEYTKHFEQCKRNKVPIVANIIGIIDRCNVEKLSELKGDDYALAFASRTRLPGRVLVPLYNILKNQPVFTPEPSLQRFLGLCLNTQ
ncbi:hypothetical protein EIN_277730 [Entamoeba invadens IP1]|uniref:Ras-GEF domain-containing protein n=1 Tax=Entamoeba invadens IP1 TaxID=370355 RepID=A0A0A1U0C8_ENTIV|nr:hypothetical protein EIN_277730 [Entamoeba invadens IP1]ELP84343.1 hypothetical protein EIN_277730 [Entamoeba invadens IP1]|eukprot:XP_004183689.1 hypothetical protein EIN_277730 [Entamoeba invadens IP1]